MHATAEPDVAPRPAWRRGGSWALGYPATVTTGIVFAVIFAVRGQWAGTAVLAALAVVMAGGERWADRRHLGGTEWPAFRRSYSAFVLIAAVVYAGTTGDEFYVVVFPGLIFVPSVSAIGRGLRARREARPESR